MFVQMLKKSSYYKPLDELMCMTFPDGGVFALSDLLMREGYRSQIVHLGVEWIDAPKFSPIDWLGDKEVPGIGLPLHCHFRSFDVQDDEGQHSGALS